MSIQRANLIDSSGLKPRRSGFEIGRHFGYNGASMRYIIVSFLLLGLLGSGARLQAREGMPAGAMSGDESHVSLPSGITCCDEQKIRLAMTEEALARIVARSRAGSQQSVDYLCEQAYEKVRRLLKDVSPDRRLDFLRDMLPQPAAEAENGEFQTLVGNFVLGMTLEIGQTLQDEYDQALAVREKIRKLLAELEKLPDADEEDLGQILFQKDISEKELRRIRGLGTKWHHIPAGTPPFDEFNALKKNVTGRAPDPDQRMAFELAERYRVRFPFLDEFLENYRRLADGFHADVWNLSDRLAALKK